jgi:glycosyltransferase involved in cell wall biosynthesis
MRSGSAEDCNSDTRAGVYGDSSQQLMPARLAYLVGANLVPAAEQDWTKNPRPEYLTFTKRNQSTLLDYRFLETCASSPARAFLKEGKPHVALAAGATSLRGAYDAYLVSGEDVGLPLTLMMRLTGNGTPIYIITHGSYFGSWKFPWLMRLIRRFKDVHFLCLSESLRATLQTRFGISPDLTHNTGYGVDTDFFRPNKAHSLPLIVSAGTATRDYRTLVKAAEGFTVRVEIAADSAWFPTAVDIDGETLPPNVEARSYGNYLGLRELYADASFVVVPLYPAQHACGYAVIVEAMAMGKPVIATRTDACSDFIIEGETGYYVPPCDVEALRGSMRYLLENPDRAREMGANARRLIAEKYSLDAYCERMETVLRQRPTR